MVEGVATHSMPASSILRLGGGNGDQYFTTNDLEHLRSKCKMFATSK